MSFQRTARALLFSGTLVGAAFIGHKWAKTDKLGIQGFPTPLPEFEGSTNDEKLKDTVNRYSRMAPVYDSALDAVESKYNGFELRKALLSKAHGDVLEIGVGTARNLPYYNSENVNSLTFVDSTYPMLNAALVKVKDLYELHHTNSAIATADENFQFEVKKSRSLQELGQLERDFLKEKYQQIAQGIDDNSNGDSPHFDLSSEAVEQFFDNKMRLNSPSSEPIKKVIHSTYRPQIIYPLSSDETDGNKLKLDFDHYLSKFPLPIRKLFQNSSTLTITNTNNLPIEHENVIGAKLYNAPPLPPTLTQSDQSGQNSPSASQFSDQPIKPTDRRSIEEYDSFQKGLIKKIAIGQSWKGQSNPQNIIPSAFLHLDCHDLSFFPSNSYHTIVDTFGLCSFHHPVDVLREIRRICKPGGKILLLEHGLGTNFVINQVIRSTNDTHKKQWGCDRSKDIVELLRESGFDVELVKRHHGGTTVVWEGSPAKTLGEIQEDKRGE